MLVSAACSDRALSAPKFFMTSSFVGSSIFRTAPDSSIPGLLLSAYTEIEEMYT